ncbi:PepP Xaa-Pro aminopeptidase [Candidatus Nanopelagicaceae bacterium]
MSAFNQRIQPIRDLMKAKGLDAFVLRRNPNLAWAIAGRAHVPTTIDMACFDLIITQDSATVITNVIEAPRLIAEELPSEVNVNAIKWSEGRDPQLPTGSKVGSDQPGADRIDLGVEVEIMRASLIASDVDRFTAICTDAAVALGNAMKQVESSDREIDVAGLIAHSLWQADLEIAFLGVAGEDRVNKFRHPLPTDAVVGNRVSASICAKRKGLIASVTRILTFGEVSDSMINDYTSIFKVEAALLDATVVGKPFSDPINAAIAAYPVNGFDADEWTKHHQGGPTGFLPRDWPANQGSARLIANNQPIAWNPTGKGWKAEDTILATDSGVKLLTNDPDWPAFEVNGRTRAFLLQK